MILINTHLWFSETDREEAVMENKNLLLLSEQQLIIEFYEQIREIFSL